MELEMDDGSYCTVDPDHLDAVLERKWLDVTDEGCNVSEKGVWHLNKWLKKNKLLVRPRVARPVVLPSRWVRGWAERVRGVAGGMSR